MFFINDLPDSLSSNVRLFADDAVLYRNITSENDSKILQLDLSKLESWAKDWLMELNHSKCQSMTITRKRKTTNRTYILHNELLERVSEVKYMFKSKQLVARQEVFWDF